MLAGSSSLTPPRRAVRITRPEPPGATSKAVRTARVGGAEIVIYDEIGAFGILAKAFLDELKARSLYEPSLVVVVADHGEAFFEHGKVLHSTVHREVLEVPLLVRWPGGRHGGERRTTPSGAVDLAPTLLAAAGIEAPDLPGTPLRARPRERPVFSGVTSKSIVVGKVHAIFDVRTGEGELYHLGRDPRERNDLAAAHPHAIGVPVPGGALRIHEPDATGTGELVYRGPNVMLGYATNAADLALGLSGRRTRSKRVA